MSISKFPIFKELELGDQKYVEAITKKYAPYSDFNFTSMWLNKHYRISDLYNNLVVRFAGYLTETPFLSFLGNNETFKTIEILVRHAQAQSIDKELKLVPEASLIKNFEEIKKRYKIEEDIDNFDYIYSLEEVANLDGNKYHKQRNMVVTFINSLPNITAKKIDIFDKKIQKEIEDLSNRWLKNKQPEEISVYQKDIDIEKRIFDLSHNINLISVGVYIGNALVGLSVNEILNNKYAIAHIRKGDIVYKGVYKYLEQETAKLLKSLDCTYLNYEQDLGIQGLKNAKMLWNPINYLKKYKIG